MLGQSSLLAAMMAAPASGVRPQDVFATSLYTGNGSTQTITNGINLSGEGGLVWVKDRVVGFSHALSDTLNGAGKELNSSATSALGTATGVSAFNSNGFTLNTARGSWNDTGTNYASWSFRRAPKFFDVVTYTGNGAAGRTISHNLGVAPGMVIIKVLNQSFNWVAAHRALTGDKEHLYLNLTDAVTSTSGLHTTFSSGMTASVITVGNAGLTNASGNTYVAYLFAHDTDTSGIVQCGSYTGNGSSTGPTVTLGWRPQFLMIKAASQGGDNWPIFDSARSTSNPRTNSLWANSSNSEITSKNLDFTSTGFQPKSSADGEINSNGATYIYLAIREPT